MNREQLRSLNQQVNELRVQKLCAEFDGDKPLADAILGRLESVESALAIEKMRAESKGQK